MDKVINFNGKNINLDSLSIDEIRDILNEVNQDEQRIKQELNEILDNLN